ncbi:hypothetical protein Mapa_002425 [Marchantia paleacea]|nr:hypothetical protein Mapa_002425 [Marchantia paleacea]
MERNVHDHTVSAGGTDRYLHDGPPFKNKKPPEEVAAAAAAVVDRRRTTAIRSAGLDNSYAWTGDAVMDLNESPDRDGFPEPPDLRK